MKRIFIITGASQGLGAALVAKAASYDNALVVAVTRQPMETEKLISNVQNIICDLARLPDASAILESVSFDNATEIVFISNAATIGPILELPAVDETDLLATFWINCFSPIRVAAQLVTKCRDLGIALKIINLSSGAADRGISNWGTYCASKSASRMFFEVLSKENPDCFITSYDPGVIDTQMQEELRNADFPDVDSFKQLYRDNRLQSPLEAAKKLLTENGVSC